MEVESSGAKLERLRQKDLDVNEYYLRDLYRCQTFRQHVIHILEEGRSIYEARKRRILGMGARKWTILFSAAGNG